MQAVLEDISRLPHSRRLLNAEFFVTLRTALDERKVARIDRRGRVRSRVVARIRRRFVSTCDAHLIGHTRRSRRRDVDVEAKGAAAIFCNRGRAGYR